jgi:DNA-binding NtrC family response regulator
MSKAVAEINAAHSTRAGERRSTSTNGGATHITQAEEALTNRIDVLQKLSLAITREIGALANFQRTRNEHRPLDFFDEVQRFEVDLILRALWRAGGNQRRAAKMLGIKATTLSSKIKRYNISPESIVACFGVLDKDDASRGEAEAA